ncbi:MAG: hypothetical protein ACK5SX_01105 [Sandaracinobacter sp.]
MLQGRAQVEAARLNLGYATVTAPISGQARCAQVADGALVSTQEGTLLTVIEQVNTVFVNFSQSSSELVAIRRDIASGELKVPGIDKTRVELHWKAAASFRRRAFWTFSTSRSTSRRASRRCGPNSPIPGPC